MRKFRDFWSKPANPKPEVHGLQVWQLGLAAFGVPDRLTGLSSRFNAQFRVKCPNPCFSK